MQALTLTFDDDILKKVQAYAIQQGVSVDTLTTTLYQQLLTSKSGTLCHDVKRSMDTISQLQQLDDMFGKYTAYTDVKATIADMNQSIAAYHAKNAHFNAVN